ncbi:Glycosyl hydrolases family 2, TIM barrel domain [Mucilaginibacter pineti]|uniref:Glycosyl hydrolases family 2, TIM barrel domain n=1 Tax=Mucilaginibacter pineti TaxID=1391627 RepID=A0A1G7IIM9_9SPHI|nr:sugar-binding domain-containing protein [Mucilaginibacter pineti]SDF12503.1 Glycosyl hydrolases family 2, TIM barrel domain [Mucilaginibacter pineti]
MIKKNKKNICLAIMIACGLSAGAQSQSGNYQMQQVQLQTRWAKEVSPANALKEYPRPQMVRGNWTNLNGLWDYAITGKDVVQPSVFEGRILVPFPLESALSGVKKALKPDELLWYKRRFNFKANAGERTMLNFGAVDYQCWVFVNGREVGSHEGGYTAFSMDISSALHDGQNEILIKVYDPSDAGYGPRGKQVLNPRSIYYTPTSGIWQTVWMETVPAAYIESLDITPDIDKGLVKVKVRSAADLPVTLALEGKIFNGKSNQWMSIPVKHAKLWSPASPFLYDLWATLGKDKVKSYFGMRKVSVAKDAAGVERIMLNNKPYYNLGTLDQGFWPDGLYTAPTDEALAFDIKAIKAMGFNTIRKHIKVEPARWYYHADKLGMLVWQDFVQPNPGLPPGAKEIFEKQGAEMLSQLHNFPCITTWVLFNEKWGAYDQARLTSWIKNTDPSRIVNGHSGEYLYVNDKLRSESPDAYINADITDVHSYPQPMNSVKIAGKAQVCGEFGGIGVFIPDHQWNTETAWGYVNEKPADLKAKYAGMNASLEKFAAQGMSGSIYTQPFDVEGEQNGLMTYDREIVKIPFSELRKIHTRLNPDLQSAAWMKYLKSVTAQDADLTDPAILSQRALVAFEGGSRDQKTLQAVVRGVSKIADPGFKAMLSEQEAFRSAMGRATYSRFMYEMLFRQEIQQLFNEQKSWEQIADHLKSHYGEVGEETYLRIKSLGALNGRDWAIYRDVAKVYLEKFGNNLQENERLMFQKALKENP